MFEHVRTAGLDPEVARGETSVEAVAMATPCGGSAVVQRPFRLAAPRRFGFHGLQADAQEGRGMQRIARIFLVLETLGQLAFGGLEGVELGAECGGL